METCKILSFVIHVYNNLGGTIYCVAVYITRRSVAYRKILSLLYLLWIMITTCLFLWITTFTGFNYFCLLDLYNISHLNMDWGGTCLDSWHFTKWLCISQALLSHNKVEQKVLNILQSWKMKQSILHPVDWEFTVSGVLQCDWVSGRS